jgi:hypothetical protein
MSNRDLKTKDSDNSSKFRKETYKGHDDRRKKIFIDGRPINWGQIGKTFYLNVYAYDPGKTLDEVIKRYIDHLDKMGSNVRQEAE